MSWSANAIFSDNTANEHGGALYIWDSMDSATGDAIFSDSPANKRVAQVIRNSDAIWGTLAFFLDNTAGTDEGAIYMTKVGQLGFELGTVFLRNSAFGYGGAASV